MKAKVLTVSDGVVDGTREDRSGAALEARLQEAGFGVVERRVVADGTDRVAAALRDLAGGFAGVVVTTGGTGFGPRDLTPEGTRAIWTVGAASPRSKLQVARGRTACGSAAAPSYSLGLAWPMQEFTLGSCARSRCPPARA